MKRFFTTAAILGILLTTVPHILAATVIDGHFVPWTSIYTAPLNRGYIPTVEPAGSPGAHYLSDMIDRGSAPGTQTVNLKTDHDSTDALTGESSTMNIETSGGQSQDFHLAVEEGPSAWIYGLGLNVNHPVTTWAPEITSRLFDPVDFQLFTGSGFGL